MQPGAQIIECNYADVDLDKIIHTHLFNFERAATSAGWIRGIEQQVSEEEEKEAHYHHEDEHHHDDCGIAEALVEQRRCWQDVEQHEREQAHHAGPDDVDKHPRVDDAEEHADGIHPEGGQRRDGIELAEKERDAEKNYYMKEIVDVS